MSVLYNRLLSLCAEKGITGYRMSKDSGVSVNLMTDLKSGRKKGLSAENANKIAAYFGVSVGYLLGTDEQKEKPAPVSGDELSAEARTIGAAFDASVPELRAAIKALLSRGEAPKLLEEDIKITCPLNQREQVIRQPYYLVGGKRMAVLNNGCENCHQCQECELCQARVMRKISE